VAPVRRYARPEPDRPAPEGGVVGYVEDLLATNEEIVYETRKHWIAPLFATLAGTLMSVGGIVLLLFTWAALGDGWLNTGLVWVGWILLAIGLVLLAVAFVRWWSETYFVTNQKVMKVGGILTKTADGSALEKINDITIRQSVLGRWLGYGTLSVLTAAGDSDLNYTAMRAPMEFRRVVLDQKQHFEQQDARTIAEAVRGAVPSAPAEPVAEAPSGEDITATIERLAALRDTGAITPEEFEAKKTELLGRL
jgi:uncharacterized membrane protein YdbT with pleckstrin-like domain